MVRKIAPVVCVAILLVGLAWVSDVRSQQYNLDTFLVGKWHQQYGPNVTETLFSGDNPHEFIALTVQPGTSYRFCVLGQWEIRNGNQLWQHNLRWIPNNVQVPEWESTQIQVIDGNHLRANGVDVYRIGGGVPCPP